MENKKTTELINLLQELKEDDYQSGGKYEQLIGELKSREPFLQILSKDWDDSLPVVWEVLKRIQEDIKSLKRHKHDEKTGDVLIRI